MQALIETSDENFDPFDGQESRIMPATNPSTDWGARVSIDTPHDELMARLAGLIRREGALDAVGITCPLKDNPEMSCIACPFSKAERPELEGRCQLCRIGINQERVSSLLVAQASGQPG